MEREPQYKELSVNFSKSNAKRKNSVFWKAGILYQKTVVGNKEKDMNFLDKINGRDKSLARLDFEKRVSRLPESYQNIWADLSTEIERYSDLTGRNLIPILSSLLEFFEETVSDDEDVLAVIDADKKAFVAELFDQRKPIP